MKNRFTAMLLLVLMFVSGCSVQPAETPTSPTEPAAKKTTLSVYMVDADALFVDAVSSFRKQGGSSYTPQCLQARFCQKQG